MVGREPLQEEVAHPQLPAHPLHEGRGETGIRGGAVRPDEIVHPRDLGMIRTLGEEDDTARQVVVQPLHVLQHARHPLVRRVVRGIVLVGDEFPHGGCLAEERPLHLAGDEHGAGVAPVEVGRGDELSVGGPPVGEDREEVGRRVEPHRHAADRAGRIRHVTYPHAVVARAIGQGGAIVRGSRTRHARIGAEPLQDTGVVERQVRGVALRRHVLAGVLRQEPQLHQPHVLAAPSGGQGAVIALHEEVIHQEPGEAEHQQQLQSDRQARTPAVHQLFAYH